MKQKVLLMILDGWGIGNRSKGDVISTVHPAYISAMTEKYPHAQLHTDGENVGLPDGQMATPRGDPSISVRAAGSIRIW